MNHTSSNATVNSVGALLEPTTTVKQSITNDNSDDGEDTYDLRVIIHQRLSCRLQQPSVRLKFGSSVAHCVKIEKTTKRTKKLKHFLELTKLEKM